MDEAESSEPLHLSRRKEIEQQIALYSNWVRSLQASVDSGKMTSENMAVILARSLVAKDLLNERATDKVNRAKYDKLTGLPGRTIFEEKMVKLMDKNHKFGLLLIDTDDFKSVNDNYGHLVGDQVLVNLANTMLTSVRQTREEGADTVSRWGGEEFAIILPGVDNNGDLEKIAEKLRGAVEQIPVITQKEGQEIKINVTVSVGGGIYDSGTTKEELMEKVDKSLYQSKENGKNRVTLSGELNEE